MITVEEAFQAIRKHVRPHGTETIPLSEAVGRVLGKDVFSDVDSPPHDKSVMDGFAVASADIASGVVQFKVLETIIAGAQPTLRLQPGTCSRVMTGAPLPAGADAVVMVEHSDVGYADATPATVKLTVEAPIDQFKSGKHVMWQSQNFATGSLMFKSRHKIRPTDIGLLAEVGAAEVSVFARPSVAIAPTGDELVDCSQRPGASQIRNSNGPMLRAICEQHGCAVTDLGIGADSPEEIEQRIGAGLKHDLLLLSGGVSAGTMDLVPGLLESCGVKKIFHKVKVKPGKPIYFGVYDRADGGQCVVFGLPGNPVSSLIGMHLFASTAIRIKTQHRSAGPVSWSAELAAPHQTRGDRPTYWPGRLVTQSPTAISTIDFPPCDTAGPFDAANATKRMVEPLPWNGSSDLLSLGTAEGLILFPPRADTWQTGERVAYFPL